MTFGEKIQRLRKEAGLSQEELAYQLGGFPPSGQQVGTGQRLSGD